MATPTSDRPGPTMTARAKTMTELAYLTASELVEAYANGSVSPVDASRAALAAIEAGNDSVNAFVLVDSEAAISAATRSEARWRSGKPAGPGDGVPTSIKDLLLTSGWPTLRGSTLVDDHGPWADDAPAVARLRETGAILLGKTTTPEFGWKGVTDSSRYGATGNPWDPTLTAGGSSGGSAAAVALGMGAWSVGTDGGGSLRIPAAFTGTVTIKPTYGLVPLWPASPFGTLSHAGPITRTVGDAALLLDLLTGFDPRDWSALPTPSSSFRATLEDGVRGLRIAFSANLGYVRNDPDVASAVQAAASVLLDAGAEVEAVDPGFGDPLEAFHVLWFAGAAKVLQTYKTHDGEMMQRVDRGLLRAAERGADISVSDYLDATAVRVDLGMRMGRFHQTYDLLLAPTLPIAAFPKGADVPPGWPSGDWTTWTPYTYPFNMTQQPAASVPCGFTSDGLPIGLQIVGPRHADALVLRAARAYERAVDWTARRPPTGQR
jgi:aspartyl-tRNA(Asn)/glutamyl-tRNA(Gln) amidotransferase subunit A